MIYILIDHYRSHFGGCASLDCFVVQVGVMMSYYGLGADQLFTTLSDNPMTSYYGLGADQLFTTLSDNPMASATSPAATTSLANPMAAATSPTDEMSLSKQLKIITLDCDMFVMQVLEKMKILTKSTGGDDRGIFGKSFFDDLQDDGQMTRAADLANKTLIDIINYFNKDVFRTRSICCHQCKIERSYDVDSDSKIIRISLDFMRSSGFVLSSGKPLPSEIMLPPETNFRRYIIYTANAVAQIHSDWSC